MKHGHGLEHKEMPKELRLFSFQRRPTEEIVVVFNCLTAGQREKKGEGWWEGRHHTHQLQQQGLRLRTTISTKEPRNTATGAQGGCATSILGDTDCTGPAQSGAVWSRGLDWMTPEVLSSLNPSAIL